MEAFKTFMTDTKILLPNWSWIAIALVVAAVIIIIACSVAAGRKKKQDRQVENTAPESESKDVETYGSTTVSESENLDKLIEPFYPVPDSAEVYEGAPLQSDEITAPAEPPVEEKVVVATEEVREEKAEPAEEIEYRSEQVAAPERVDEVTYSAVITPVVESEEKPAKKTAAKKTATAKKSTAKSTAKKPAAKKTTTAKSTAKTTSKSTAKKPAPKKTETKTVRLVKEEEEIKEVKQPEPVKAETAKPAKKTAAKPAAKKPAEKKVTATKAQPAKAANPKPAKSDSIPKVSAVLNEDIPEPVRTEPEVAPKKASAKQTVLKTANEKEEKQPAPKKTEKVKTEKVKAEPKKAEPKAAAKKSAAKKPAPKKAEIADVSQKVAKSTPKGPEKIYHVSRRPQDNKWEVRLEGSSKAIKLFRTKAEAMDYAIPLAGDDSDNSRVIIHKADGRPKNVAFL